jgi:hypothetical protein
MSLRDMDALKGRKTKSINLFRPSGALFIRSPYQGFATLTPGYFLSRLRRWACLIARGSEF